MKEKETPDNEKVIGTFGGNGRVSVVGDALHVFLPNGMKLRFEGEDVPDPEELLKAMQDQYNGLNQKEGLP